MSRFWAVAAASVMVWSASGCGNNNPSQGQSTDESGTEQPCNSDKDCNDGAACCSGQCEDLGLSNDACGACGVQCTANQYCTGTACVANTFSALCGNANFKVIHRGAKSVSGTTDDPSTDNAAADSLATSLGTLCGPTSPTAVVTAETDVLANSTAGPLTTGRGTTMIVSGGRIYSYIIDYMDDQDVTPVELVVTTNDNFQIVSRSERKVIVQDSLDNLNENLDYVVGQSIYDATSGTQLLNVYGIMITGTTTGVAYFAQQVAQAGFGSTFWFVGKVQNGTVTRLDGQ